MQVFMSLPENRAPITKLYRLAETYKATPMVGRSHGVQALPITFGHKCAIWLSEMGRNHQRLRELEKRLFVGGMAGAVGTRLLCRIRVCARDHRRHARQDR